MVKYKKHSNYMFIFNKDKTNNMLKNMEEKYRHEYKYIISAAQLAILRARADAIMQKDSHTKQDGEGAGSYNIRSVYFDDIEGSAYNDIENGVDPREKFRIRIYNHSAERIMLELKRKTRTMCNKTQCELSRGQCETLISGGCLPNDKSYPPILQKLLIEIKTRGLHPVVISEYERIPYIYPIGNVRVTFDINTRSSSQCKKFFDEKLAMRPVLQTGQQLFEVKWDELLPDFIYRSLMLENLQWDSFSKFFYCRRFLTDQTNIL